MHACKRSFPAARRRSCSASRGLHAAGCDSRRHGLLLDMCVLWCDVVCCGACRRAEDKEHCEEYGRMLGADPTKARTARACLGRCRMVLHACAEQTCAVGSHSLCLAAVACIPNPCLKLPNVLVRRPPSPPPLCTPQVSGRAKKRGLPQLGTLGAGNHYAEVQVRSSYRRLTKLKLKRSSTHKNCLSAHPRIRLPVDSQGCPTQIRHMLRPHACTSRGAMQCVARSLCACACAWAGGGRGV